MTANHPTPIVLTIAGSDSSGGAGIQADIKSISATGGYACSVITALTAQNTQGVSAIYPISADFVSKQLDSVFSDLNIVAVKIGMLADTNIIHAVANALKKYTPKHIVVDPVMVATSGDLLLEQSAISTLKSELLPLADIITPNLPEAATLVGSSTPRTSSEMLSLVEKLGTLNYNSILLKGGHLQHDCSSNDLLIDKHTTTTFTTKRIHTLNTHGTGCSLSSAIASYLAQGHSLSHSVQQGKKYITGAIAHADELQIGHGHGPVHHFFAAHPFICATNEETEQ